MAFYQFSPDDIVNTVIVTYPSQAIKQNNNGVTGSIYLEKKYLDSSLTSRQFQGFSDKEGGFVTADGPFTSSLDFISATRSGSNSHYFSVIERLCTYYGTFNNNYSTTFSGTQANEIRIVNIPEVYYDKQIVTGSLFMEDIDNLTGLTRSLQDDGDGNIIAVNVSGVLSGSAVGRIFYQEGLVFLNQNLFNFGQPSADYSYEVDFKGTHRIPVKIFRCRAPIGHLNASTNPTYFQILTSSDARFKNEKEIVMENSTTYITTIGLYNEEYRLVGLAKLAQPIKKEIGSDILFRVKIDF